MKNNLFLLVLFSFIFLSCEKEEEIFESDLQNSSDIKTRSFDHYISGPTTVNQGEAYYYYLEGMSYVENSYWSCTNGEVLSYRDDNALIYFENPGNAQIMVNSTETDRYTPITEYLNVTVLPFDNGAFLSSVSIVGPEETQIGKQVNYKIYTSYRNYIVNDVSWTLDGAQISMHQSFNHTFYKSGYYNLKCTGSFSSVEGGSPISFEKEVRICVKTETGENPDYTLDDVFCSLRITDRGRTAAVYFNFIPKNATITYKMLNFNDYRLYIGHAQITLTHMSLTDKSTIEICITLGKDQRIITHEVKYSDDSYIRPPRR